MRRTTSVAVEARGADVLADALPQVAVAVANIARAPVERATERFAGRLVIASGYLDGGATRAVRVAQRRPSRRRGVGGRPARAGLADPSTDGRVG